MPKKGDIVLVLFPFTDFSGEKRRPALVVGTSQEHVIALFITSRETGEKTWRMTLPASRQTGLKLASAIRVDKIASIDGHIIMGAIGSAPSKTMPKVNALLKKLFLL
jgi:mRNA interferase MazF